MDILPSNKSFFLYKQILEYKPEDKEEIASKKKFLKLIESSNDPFDRETMPGHITGSGIVVDKEFEHVLLTYHKKIGLWLQFGGHSDKDPNPFAVAFREVFEESGITDFHFDARAPTIFDIDVHKINSYKGFPEHFHYDVRMLLVVDFKTKWV